MRANSFIIGLAHSRSRDEHGVAKHARASHVDASGTRTDATARSMRSSSRSARARSRKFRPSFVVLLSGVFAAWRSSVGLCLVPPPADVITYPSPLLSSVCPPEHNGCARLVPHELREVGLSQFREHAFEVAIENTGSEAIVVNGGSTDSPMWRIADLVPGERIGAGKKRKYELRYNSVGLGNLLSSVVFQTNLGNLLMKMSVTVYRNPYGFTPLTESVPFDVPVEFDLKMFNPLNTPIAIRHAWTTNPDVTLEPALVKISAANERLKSNSGTGDQQARALKWNLVPGEETTMLRLKVLIRKDDFKESPTQNSVAGFLVLNITSENFLTRIPFTFMPHKNLIYIVEKHLAFSDLSSARDKDVVHLHVFNSRSSALEIQSVFSEDPDRDLSIKFGSGTIVPPLSTARIARITRKGSIEGYFKGAIQVHTNASHVPLRVTYSSLVVHGHLEYDADEFVFQAPVGPYGEPIQDNVHDKVRRIKIKNSYSQPVELRAWHILPEDLTNPAFPIQSLTAMDGQVLQPAQSMAVDVYYAPKRYLTAISSTLRILHNASKAGTRIPLVVYSGELTTQSDVDFGILSLGVKKQMDVIYRNDNPIAIEVHTVTIKGARRITAMQVGVIDLEVGDDEMSDVGECIEKTGRICTKVLRRTLDPGESLRLSLEAHPRELQDSVSDAELMLKTSTGVDTATRLQLVASNGKLLSEDGGYINIEIPLMDLVDQAHEHVTHDVMVHSTHGVPVGVTSFLETDSDLLGFEPSGDVVIGPDDSSKLGLLFFDTSRQSNVISNFLVTSPRSWSKKFRKRKTRPEELVDIHEVPVTKVDVHRLGELEKSVARLIEDDALEARGKLQYASEAREGRQTIDVRIELTRPHLLKVRTHENSPLRAMSGSELVSKGEKVTLRVKNPSTRRQLCIRALPVITASQHSRRKKPRKESFHETNLRAARSFAQVGETYFEDASHDPGFLSELKVGSAGVCLQPEQEIDILVASFEPRKRLHSYEGTFCVKNEFTVLECLVIEGDSGTSGFEDEEPNRDATLPIALVAMTTCVLVAYWYAQKQRVVEEEVASRQKSVVRRTKAASPLIDKAIAPREHEPTGRVEEQSVVAEPMKNTEDVAPPSPVLDEAPERVETDSAIEVDHASLSPVVASPATTVASPPESLTSKDREEKRKKHKEKKSTDRGKTRKKDQDSREGGRPRKEKRAEGKSPVKPAKSHHLIAPRRIMVQAERQKAASIVSSERSADWMSKTQSLGDADDSRSMFAYDISDPLNLSPVPSAPPSRPGSVTNYNMWGRSGSLGGFDSSTLFSFPSDGVGAHQEHDATRDEPFSPQSVSRSSSVWRSMLSEWEKTADDTSRSESRDS